MNIKNLLNIDQKIILASKSPRRKHLLGLLGFEFDVVPANIDEEAVSFHHPGEMVMNLAEMKAINVAEKTDENSLVIGSDTTVELKNNVLNKPKDEDHAIEMLKTLSGKKHKVLSGISLAMRKNSEIIKLTAFELTEVTFRDLSEEEIKAYVNSGSPMDKAGAYGIQDDFGAVFVKNINGCYYNIVGLPLQVLYIKLIEFQQKYL